MRRTIFFLLNIETRIEFETKNLRQKFMKSNKKWRNCIKTNMQEILSRFMNFLDLIQCFLIFIPEAIVSITSKHEVWLEAISSHYSIRKSREFMRITKYLHGNVKETFDVESCAATTKWTSIIKFHQLDIWYVPLMLSHSVEDNKTFIMKFSRSSSSAKHSMNLLSG